MILLLLAMAGVTYAMQEVVGPVFLRRVGWRWLGELLSCSVCTGFHAGWIVWLLSEYVPDVVLFAFAGAGVGMVARRL